MLVRNQITYILEQATQPILLAFCLKKHFYIFRLKLDLELYFYFKLFNHVC